MRIAAIIILLAGLLPGCGGDMARRPEVDIDLTRLVWRAGPDFAPPAFPGADEAFREIRSFPVILNKIFPASPGSQVRKFTLFTRFSLSAVERESSLALFLPAIGENWAVYLNGQQLRREIYLDDDGRMTRRRTIRGITILLPNKYLRTGDNLLLFHVAGERSRMALVESNHPGFYLSDGYRIADQAYLIDRNSDTGRMILAALYLFFGIYHAVLFLGRRSERYNVYFALFSCALAAYVFIRSRHSFDLIGDLNTEYLYRLDYFTVILFLPLFFRFLHYYFFATRRPFPLIQANALLYMIFGAAVWALPFGYVVGVLRLWQLSVLVFAVYMMYLVGLGLYQRKRDAGLLAISITAMLFTTVWDITAAIFLFSSVRLFEYSFFGFVMAIVLIIARRFLRLHRELERLNLDLSLQRQEFFTLNQNLEQEIHVRTEKYLQAKQDAEEAARAKSAFLANMSHEIRTPLNAVLGMSDLLGESKMDTTQSRYVSVLRKAGSGLLALVNDILDISKIEAGELNIESRPVELRELAEDAVAILRPDAESKNLEFHIHLAEDLPAHCLGDYARLRQILLNLLGNAIKFTEAGQVRLELRLVPNANANSNVNSDAVETQAEVARDAASEVPRFFLEFLVIDTGIGIPADKQERIFESFAQADDSTTRMHGGTGLGLTISRHLASSMGGVIALESVAGQGSEFCLRLPYRATDSVPVEKAESVILRDWSAVGSVRILLAEDNPDNVLLFEIYLKELPCQIDLAANGLRALELFQQNEYDLVFMDIQMPELDGLESTRRIRSFEASQPDRQRTPIFALTANAFDNDVRDSSAAGCDGHITKPFTRAELVAVVSRVQESTA